MTGRSLTRLLLFAAFSAITGCSLLHHGESPQQQFITAVQRGNSAQASQIWLNMNADDRANLAHSIGFKPATSADDVQRALARRQQAADAAANASGDGGDFTASSQTQATEPPGLDIDLHAGSLQNLPSLATTTATPPAPAEEDAP